MFKWRPGTGGGAAKISRELHENAPAERTQKNSAEATWSR